MAMNQGKIFPTRSRSIWDTQAYNVFDIQGVPCFIGKSPVLQPLLRSNDSSDCGKEIDVADGAVDAAFG